MGSIMQNYELIKKIGEGTFGKAWLAENIITKKLFVIKGLKASKMKDKDKTSAYTEVAVLSCLKHPYIVSYVEYFKSDVYGYFCIVMEYCDGGDLHNKIVEQKEKGLCFEEDQIIDWFYQLTSALNYVHSHKILHRDLKSQNIFLKNGSLKLGDFGIARILKDTFDFAKTCIGSPIAFSPEIVQGESYNYKSDIWSLGCVIYELTMLKLPFLSDSINGLFCKILRADFEPIRVYYSKELSNVISKMLSRSPLHRPNTNEILSMTLLQKQHIMPSNEESKNIVKKIIRKIVKSPSPAVSDKSTSTEKIKAESSFHHVNQDYRIKLLSRQHSEEKALNKQLQQRAASYHNYKNNIAQDKNETVFREQNANLPLAEPQCKRFRSRETRITDKPPSPYNIFKYEDFKSGINLQVHNHNRGRSRAPKWTPPTIMKKY